MADTQKRGRPSNFGPRETLEGMWNIHSFMGPALVVAVAIESREETYTLWKPVVWELIPIKGWRKKTFSSELPHPDPRIGKILSSHANNTPYIDIRKKTKKKEQLQ